MSIEWDTEDVLSSKNLKAKHINDGSDALQNFVNEGIRTPELATKKRFTENLVDPYDFDGWVDGSKIYRPEFYGSPSPRMTAVSGQTHFREVANDFSEGVLFNPELNGANATPVPDTATRIKLKHTATVNIMASFYMFELGGVALSSMEINMDDLEAVAHPMIGSLTDSVSGVTNEAKGYESLRAGTVRLRVDGRDYDSTRRCVYVGKIGPRNNLNFVEGTDADFLYVQRGFLFHPMINRHQHHIQCQVRLRPGVHDIGLSFEPQQIARFAKIEEYPLLDWFWSNQYIADFTGRVSTAMRPGFPKIKHIFFLARNFIVDAYYEDNV